MAKAAGVFAAYTDRTTEMRFCDGLSYSFKCFADVLQIDMIYNLLCGSGDGHQTTQSLDRQARAQLYQTASRGPSPPSTFYHVTPTMTQDSAHLLSRLLVWSPVSAWFPAKFVA